MASASPRPKSRRSEVSVKTYAKIRKSELDLEKECTRLEQEMVSRLTAKERQIQKYISESPSQQPKTNLRRSGSDSADVGSSQLCPSSSSRPRSASTSEMSRQNSSNAAKPHVRSSSISQSPRPSARKMSPVLPKILVDGGEEIDKESQVRKILAGEPVAFGNSQERKHSSEEFSLPALPHKNKHGRKGSDESRTQHNETDSRRTSAGNGGHSQPGPRRKKASASLGDIGVKSGKDLTKAYSRSRSVPQSSAVIPKILVDEDVEMAPISSLPENDMHSSESNCSSAEPSPPCSPVSSPLVKPKTLHSSSTEALIHNSDSTGNNSLMPVQRTRSKSASGPRPANRAQSLPVGSPDTCAPDKETLLEMSKHLPDMKGKDGFKQFYQTSSPRPKRKWSWQTKVLITSHVILVYTLWTLFYIVCYGGFKRIFVWCYSRKNW